VHLFRPSLDFLVEAEARLKNRRGQKALFGRGAHNVFRVRLVKNLEKQMLQNIFENKRVRRYSTQSKVEDTSNHSFNFHCYFFN
jgi:hypothetical protein